MARAGGSGSGLGMGNPVNVGIAVQADWENREFISNISLNVRRLFDFLLRFGLALFADAYDHRAIDKKNEKHQQNCRKRSVI